MRFLFSFLLMLTISFLIPTKDEITFSAESNSKHCNVRYDFCLAYPSNVLPNKFVSDNNDGVTLSSQNNMLHVTCPGSPNVGGKTTAELYEIIIVQSLHKEQGDKVLSKVIRDDFYEVSFVRGGEYYFQKLHVYLNNNVTIQISGPENSDDAVNALKEKVKLKLGD